MFLGSSLSILHNNHIIYKKALQHVKFVPPGRPPGATEAIHQMSALMRGGEGNPRMNKFEQVSGLGRQMPLAGDLGPGSLYRGQGQGWRGRGAPCMVRSNTSCVMVQ